MARNLLLKVEYDGTAYKGWQRQPQAVTIEENVQQALEKIFQHPVKISVCSRTDAGVHALGQIINVFAPENIPPLKRIFFGLNSLLPADIAILDMLEVPLDYKGRNKNKGKRYSYHILNGPAPKAIGNNFFTWVKKTLDLEKMRHACSLFVGEHDFSAFRGKGCQQFRTIKNIYKTELSWEREDFFTKIQITVEGSAFLKNMVRIMVGTIIEIGKGKLQPEVIPSAFASGKRETLGITAPAKGLTLEKIFFSPDPFAERNTEAWNT